MLVKVVKHHPLSDMASSVLDLQILTPTSTWASSSNNFKRIARSRHTYVITSTPTDKL
jgi:hypothetical protein